MPSIFFKKTFKVKPSGFQVSAEKSFSFHGASVTPELIHAVNHCLRSSVQYTSGANVPLFRKNEQGHYFVALNHNCQKYHEEDTISAVLDVMEDLGWDFRFQYDSESHSVQMNGSSLTSRELFIFHQPRATKMK
jgi:hypothetical protein